MSLAAFEGVVENGQIKLDEGVRLPEKARVFVLIPGLEVVGRGRIVSPRLAHPEQAADFAMEVTRIASNDSV
jgi:hypothetical protein